MNFDIKTEQLGDDAYVISLAGEVDLYTAPEFKQQLLEVIGQGGKQVDRRLQQHDVHRLDDARRARRRREAAAHERRPALARLQRPEHHEDLRDHRPRPRLHDLPDPRRGRLQREVGRQRLPRRPCCAGSQPPPGGWLSSFCCRRAGPGVRSSMRLGRQGERAQALPGEVCRAATRWRPPARPARSARTSTPRLRRRAPRGSRSRRSSTSSTTRSSSRASTPSAQNNPDYLKANMPANLVTGQDAIDVSAFVAANVGKQGFSRLRSSPGRTASRSSSRSAVAATR